MHFDACSGIGGFAIAANACGIPTIGFAETAPYPSAILKARWPDVPNFGDIRKIPAGPTWLFTAGFPCQPFSRLGNQSGDSDPRSLWKEVVRAVSKRRARWVLLENVPEFSGMGYDAMANALEAEGYTCGAAIVPALAVGAPHFRPRLWIVANAHRRGRSMLAQLPARIEPERSSHADRRGWPSEPALGRVADGIPNRTLAIAALGNSLVPEIPRRFIHWMIQADEKTR